MNVQFDEATHTYTVDGKEYPSVTRILRPLSDFSNVPANVLQRAQEYGIAVHRMVELDIKGTLNADKLDPVLLPVLENWRQAAKDWDILYSEVKLAHSSLKYAGRFDILAVMSRGLSLIDIKTGLFDPRVAGPQTAAYAELLKNAGRGFPHRYVLTLRSDNHQLHPLEDKRDWPIFQSCLNLWRWVH